MSTTTNARKPAKTAGERKAQAEALHDSISAQVEQLRDSGRWEAFLRFASAFHKYSFGNVLLIQSQRPDASQVAGFRKWQALGRQVRKGETGIRVFGYSTTKTTPADEESTTHREAGNGENTINTVAQVAPAVRFPILSVFDIAQTEPIDGMPQPGTIVQQLTGADDFGVIDILERHLTTVGWTIERRPLPGNRNGLTDPTTRAVVLDANLSRQHTAKTLIHETAHILLGHTDSLEEYAAHRGLMETEAESVAYVVAGLAGFDTSPYSIGYIAGWSDADTVVIKATAVRVLRTAHQIADVLNPVPSHITDVTLEVG